MGLTRRLVHVVCIMGIEFLDRIILYEDFFLNMKEHGLM